MDVVVGGQAGLRSAEHWNPAWVLPEPVLPSVTELFLECVRSDPGAIAIEAQSSKHSYGELASAALFASELLRARGVGPGDVVAVFGLRGFRFIVGMLGALLSGAVLLNLDAQLPEERMKRMLGIARAKVVLNASGGAAPLIEGVTELELPALEDVGIRDFVAPVAVEPDAPAYLFFTSGSTGLPKGVLGRQRGLSHFITWQRGEFGFGPGDRFAHLTGLGFDVVLRDILSPLISGATLCVPPSDRALAPDMLLPWLDAMRITRTHCVPAVASAWLGSRVPGVTLATLRTIFFAGEPLTATLVRRFRDAFRGDYEIVNLYGPTETTLAKCCYRLPQDIAEGVQPVGFPLPQTQALVLTESNQVADVGVVGEIAIRTPFRSLGYLNGSEQDSARFFQNPFRNDQRDIIYRTGDRGRYRADGALEIMGRLDQQVKIGGVRVEPEEVNAVLARHEGVRQSVVVARQDEQGAAYLVAYVVVEAPETTTAVALRQFLKPQLLEAMVPSVFMFLDAFPLLPNGKLDRRALPLPSAPSNAAASPPEGLEGSLLAIWRSVLHTDAIGLDDSFSDLGGGSLQALQVLGQLKDKLGIQLGLGAMLTAPTVRAMAELLGKSPSALSSRLVPLQPRGSLPPLFCGPPGGGSAFFYRVLAETIGSDQPLYTFEPRGMDGKEEPLEDLRDIAATYVKELRAVQPTGPYYLCGLSFGGMIAFEIARQLEAAGHEVGLVALFDSWAPGHRRVQQSAPEWLARIERVRFSFGFHKENLSVGDLWSKADYIKRVLENKVNGRNPRSMAAWNEEALPERVRKIDVAERKARATYVPRPIKARLVLLRARLQASEIIENKFDSWPELASGGFEIIDTPGTHYSIIEYPCVIPTVAQLRRLLGEQRGRFERRAKDQPRL